MFFEVLRLINRALRAKFLSSSFFQRQRYCATVPQFEFLKMVEKVEADLPYELPTSGNWTPLARFYHPLQAGSIDGTDIFPHDRGVVRAMSSSYRPNKRVTGDPDKTLFVSRLDKNTKEQTVKDHFAGYGEIIKCRLVRDIITGFSRGYAFIEFRYERDAREACRELHKTVLDGSEVLVDLECERSLKGWIPRRFGGGFGGKKESGQLRFGGKDRPFRRPINLSENPLGKNRFQTKNMSPKHNDSSRIWSERQRSRHTYRENTYPEKRRRSRSRDR